MKAIWSYGNVFLMGVATTLLWVKWSGRWSEPVHAFTAQNTSVTASTTHPDTKTDGTVSVTDMVEILKSEEAVAKLKAGFTPRFKAGKIIGWDKSPLNETVTNASIVH